LYRRSDPSQICHAGCRGWEPLFYGHYPVHGPTAICHLHGSMRCHERSSVSSLDTGTAQHLCIYTLLAAYRSVYMTPRAQACPGAQVPLACRTRSLQIIPPIHGTDRSEHTVHRVSNPTSTHWNNPTMRGRKVGAGNCGDQNLAVSAVRILQKAKGEDRIAEARVSPRRAGESL
jgi:hypothetical protein